MIPAFLADRENRKRRGDDEELRVGDGPIIHDYDNWHGNDNDDEDEDDVPVMQMKGGSPPPPPSPMAEAQAQISLEQERARIAQADAERRRQQEEAMRMQTIEKARPLQNQAYQYAQAYGDEQIQGRGYDRGLADQYGLMDMYLSSLDRTRLGIGETDLNPMSSYNTRGMFNDAYDTAVGAYRGDLRRGIYDTAGDGFEYGMFADTADDNILAEILGTHRADTQAQLDAARARGQLNDVGYGRAQNQLGMQGESAMSSLQDLGMGVLSGYRNDLRTMRDNEVNRVNMLDFTMPYDNNVFNQRLTDRKNDLTGRMRGDLFRTTQGKSFFDPNTIISSSGAVQGFYNPTNTQRTGTTNNANPLLDAFTTQQQPANNGAF